MPPRKDINWEFGARCMLYSLEYEAWYLVNVVDFTKTQVKVNYSGWLSDSDEWVDKNSDRFDFDGGKTKWRPVKGAVGAFYRLQPQWVPQGKPRTVQLYAPEHEPPGSARSGQRHDKAAAGRARSRSEEPRDPKDRKGSKEARTKLTLMTSSAAARTGQAGAGAEVGPEQGASPGPPHPKSSSYRSGSPVPPLRPSTPSAAHGSDADRHRPSAGGEWSGDANAAPAAARLLAALAAAGNTDNGKQPAASQGKSATSNARLVADAEAVALPASLGMVTGAAPFDRAAAGHIHGTTAAQTEPTGAAASMAGAGPSSSAQAAETGAAGHVMDAIDVAERADAAGTNGAEIDGVGGAAGAGIEAATTAAAARPQHIPMTDAVRSKAGMSAMENKKRQHTRSRMEASEEPPVQRPRHSSPHMSRQAAGLDTAHTQRAEDRSSGGRAEWPTASAAAGALPSEQLIAQLAAAKAAAAHLAAVLPADMDKDGAASHPGTQQQAQEDARHGESCEGGRSTAQAYEKTDGKQPSSAGGMEQPAAITITPPHEPMSTAEAVAAATYEQQASAGAETAAAHGAAAATAALAALAARASAGCEVAQGTEPDAQQEHSCITGPPSPTHLNAETDKGSRQQLVPRPLQHHQQQQPQPQLQQVQAAQVSHDPQQTPEQGHLQPSHTKLLATYVPEPTKSVHSATAPAQEAVHVEPVPHTGLHTADVQLADAHALPHELQAAEAQEQQQQQQQACSALHVQHDVGAAWPHGDGGTAAEKGMQPMETIETVCQPLHTTSDLSGSSGGGSGTAFRRARKPAKPHKVQVWQDTGAPNAVMPMPLETNLEVPSASMAAAGFAPSAGGAVQQVVRTLMVTEGPQLEEPMQLYQPTAQGQQGVGRAQEARQLPQHVCAGLQQPAHAGAIGSDQEAGAHQQLGQHATGGGASPASAIHQKATTMPLLPHPHSNMGFDMTCGKSSESCAKLGGEDSQVQVLQKRVLALEAVNAELQGQHTHLQAQHNQLLGQCTQLRAQAAQLQAELEKQQQVASQKQQQEDATCHAMSAAAAAVQSSMQQAYAEDIAHVTQLLAQSLALAGAAQAGMLRAASKLAALDRELPVLTSSTGAAEANGAQDQQVADTASALLKELEASHDAPVQEASSLAVRLVSLAARQRAAGELLEAHTTAVRSAATRRGVQLRLLQADVRVLLPVQPGEAMRIQEIDRQSALHVPPGTIVAVPQRLTFTRAAIPAYGAGAQQPPGAAAPEVALPGRFSAPNSATIHAGDPSPHARQDGQHGRMSPHGQAGASPLHAGAAVHTQPASAPNAQAARSDDAGSSGRRVQKAASAQMAPPLPAQVLGVGGGHSSGLQQQVVHVQHVAMASKQQPGQEVQQPHIQPQGLRMQPLMAASTPHNLGAMGMSSAQTGEGVADNMQSTTPLPAPMLGQLAYPDGQLVLPPSMPSSQSAPSQAAAGSQQRMPISIYHNLATTVGGLSGELQVQSALPTMRQVLGLLPQANSGYNTVGAQMLTPAQLQHLNLSSLYAPHLTAPNVLQVNLPGIPPTFMPLYPYATPQQPR